MNTEAKTRAFPWSFFHAIGCLDTNTKMKCFLFALATHADKDGYCYPSKSTIAKYAGISEKTAYNYAEKALAMGWLEKKSKAIPTYRDGQTRHVNRYRLIIDCQMVEDEAPF